MDRLPGVAASAATSRRNDGAVTPSRISEGWLSTATARPRRRSDFDDAASGPGRWRVLACISRDARIGPEGREQRSRPLTSPSGWVEVADLARLDAIEDFQDRRDQR